MNTFFKELEKMMESFNYDREAIEFLQWYYSDEDTDALTSEDAHRYYDIAKECNEMQEADEEIDAFQEFQKRIKEIALWQKVKSKNIRHLCTIKRISVNVIAVLKTDR